VPATITKEEITQRCDAGRIEVGSVFSRHSHGKVTNITTDRGGRKVYTLRNEHGKEWDVLGSDLLEWEFSFADQFDNEITDSRSKINEILLENRRIAMTVCFRKKAKDAAAAKILAEGQGDLSDRAWLKKYRETTAGEERVMIGHHSGALDEHQRLRFIEQDKGPRLVDTRTTQWVICDRTKYIVGSK